MIINKQDAIEQLGSIRQHCKEMSDSLIADNEPLELNVWYKDVQAIDIAIKEFKKAPRDCNPKEAIRKFINFIIPHRR